MKMVKEVKTLKIRIVKRKREVNTGFSNELKKLIALKQRMPLQFVG